MTRCFIRCAAAAAVLNLLAAPLLPAAELPSGVPTYQGKKPAEKPLPKNVPVYNPESSTPQLVRRSMNAPRPGVAIPAPPPHDALPPQAPPPQAAPGEKPQEAPKKP